MLCKKGALLWRTSIIRELPRSQTNTSSIFRYQKCVNEFVDTLSSFGGSKIDTDFTLIDSRSSVAALFTTNLIPTPTFFHCCFDTQKTSGHAICLSAEKYTEDTIKITLFNSGYGIQMYHEKNTTDQKYKTSVSFYLDLSDFTKLENIIKAAPKLDDFYD